MLTLAFGAGDAFLDDCVEAVLRGERESETSGPAAEGGAFDVIGLVVSEASSVTRGIFVASGGFSRSAILSATSS